MSKKEFTVKEPELIKYLAAVRRMDKHFAGFTFRHIPRSKNVKADELAKAATQRVPMLADVFFTKKRNGPASCISSQVRIGDRLYLPTSMEPMRRIASMRQIE